MPAKTDRRHRRGQESRQRILESALAIAAERGYDGTTVALITERAGLPASSVYWQFRNKDELLAEALDYSYRIWRTEGPTWQPANYTGTPRERIVTRLTLSRGSVEREPEFWRLGLMVAMLRRSSRIAAQDRFMQVRGETQAIVDAWWRSVLPASTTAHDELARLLTHSYIAFVDGMFVAHRADPHMQLNRLSDSIGQAMATVVEQWSIDPSSVLAAVNHPTPVPIDRGDPESDEADDSRSRLLHATEDIAAERGYRGTTISRVCSRAGLPPSSVYWFFTDKDELLAEVVQHSWDEWLSRQPDWPAPEKGHTWQDTLRGILRQSVQSLLDAPSFMRIGHMLTLEQHSTEVAARTRFLVIRAGIQDRIATWFDDVVVTSGDAQPDGLSTVLAEAVIAFTDGFFLGSQIDDSSNSVPAFVEFVVEVISAAASASD